MNTLSQVYPNDGPLTIPYRRIHQESVIEQRLDNQGAQNAMLLKIALQVCANPSHDSDRRRLRNDFVTVCCECSNISIAGIVDNFGLGGEEEIMEIRKADPVALFSCVECRDPLPDDSSVKLLRSRIRTLAYFSRVEVGEPVELHKLQKLLCDVCDRDLHNSLEEERRAQCLALKARQKELSTMPYSAYLKTREWRVKRSQALIRAGSRCQFCAGTQRLEVHHADYQRRGHELLEDLVVLCRHCHERMHGIEPKAA